MILIMRIVANHNLQKTKFLFTLEGCKGHLFLPSKQVKRFLSNKNVSLENECIRFDA